MRVLYLAEDRPDYMQAIVYHGLVALLGAENVVDYPRVSRFHEHVPPEAPFPMLSFDYPTHPERGLAAELADADAVVLGAVGHDTAALLTRVLELGPAVPLVAIDGADLLYVRGLARFVDLYLKREVLRQGGRMGARMPARRLYHRLKYPERWRDPLMREERVATPRTRGVEPLPYGVIDVGFAPAPQKDHDVVFMGWPSSPQRRALAPALEELRRDGYDVVVRWGDREERQRAPWAWYMDVLSRSRIGLSLHGAGFDTYRYWEIPYANTLLLAETPRIVIPQNFRHGVEAVFAPARELVTVARRLLQGDTSEIAAAGRDAVLSRHTSVHRAQTVLDQIERLARRPRRRRTLPR